MAVYIPLIKVSEDARFAEYHFGGRSVYVPDKRRPKRLREHASHFGRLRIDKANGEVVLVSAMPEDENGFCFARAAFKVKSDWEAGSLPDRTSWSS